MDRLIEKIIALKNPTAVGIDTDVSYLPSDVQAKLTSLEDAAEAVYFAKVLDETAKMALMTEMLNPGITPINSYILDKHYFRKHGANAYYGQKSEE